MSQELQYRISDAANAGVEAADQGDLLAAEVFMRESVSLFTDVELNNQQDVFAYFTCLKNLGDVLADMSATPESEPFRVSAVEATRALFEADPVAHAEHHVKSLLALAKVYRGPICYVIPAHESDDYRPRIIRNLDQMAAVRRQRILNHDEWPLAWIPAPHWHLKSERVLEEAIRTTRTLRATSSDWTPYLALALNLLGEANILGERHGAALAPLNEAEDLYIELVSHGASSDALDMLADTRKLLATARNPTPAFVVFDENFSLRPGR
ncbi:hypothetical protein GCM10027515_32810 [Schumannella luteola]|uniref:Tetratricopeptide repeat protein n=1 Tax=Schumannella luteola TaxID=472059 RepID=A0A852YMF5_9MICO|nr:hypothetical protein [Schumannella luteola]NYG98919.1 hypothetical protein [Schumannella luteola]TPX06297.1 hypothetical protein FJ656_01240 [Schumannella luteola]